MHFTYLSIALCLKIEGGSVHFASISFARLLLLGVFLQ